MKRFPLPNLISVLVIALLAANYFGSLTDLDWSWQVRTGQLIAESGTLRTADTFSYTIDGKVLHDYEWLWEVVLWHAWNLFGMGGLKFLRVILVATPLVLLAWRLLRDHLRWHVVVLALVSAVYVVSPAWNLRPLYCTTIGLFLAWSMLHDHCTGRQRLSWCGLPLTMLVWANCHPAVITGQGLIFGAIVWEWINVFMKWNTTLDRPALRRLTLIGTVALAATFLSPEPIQRLIYPFDADLKHPIFRIFVEMQPLHTFLFRAPFVAPVVYVMAALVVLSIMKRFRHYRMWELALLAGVGLLGSVAVRSLMDLYLILLAVGLPHVCAMYVEAVKTNPRRPWLYGLLRIDNALKRMSVRPWFRWQPAWPLAFVALLLVVTLIQPLSRNLPTQNSDEWPVAALDHIEAAKIEGNFFAPPDYGAYVGWRLKDRSKIYMDTRGFFFPPALVEDSHYVPAMGPQWRQRLTRVLDEYPTNYFLLETWGTRGALWNALQPHVDTPLYRDDKTVLLTADQVRLGLAALDVQLAACQ